MTTLRITLYNARNLSGADATGKSDPFVCFTVGDITVKSKKKSSTNNPNWNGKEFDIVMNNGVENVLQVQVFDKDFFGKSDSLGSAKVDISKLKAGVQTIELVRLSGGDRGENVSKILSEAVDKGLEKQGAGGKLASSFVESEDKNYGVVTLGLTIFNQPEQLQPFLASQSPGNLTIRLFAAANLRGTDAGGKGDPRVDFSIDDNKVKGKKKGGTVNPNYKGITYQLPADSSKTLRIEVKDQDLIGKSDSMGFVDVPLNKLTPGKELISTYRLTGGDLGENLSNRAEEVKINATKSVISQFAGKTVGNLFGKISSESLNSNHGVVCVGLTI